MALIHRLHQEVSGDNSGQWRFGFTRVSLIKFIHQVSKCKRNKLDLSHYWSQWMIMQCRSSFAPFFKGLQQEHLSKISNNFDYEYGYLSDREQSIARKHFGQGWVRKDMWWAQERANLLSSLQQVSQCSFDLCPTDKGELRQNRDSAAEMCLCWKEMQNFPRLHIVPGRQNEMWRCPTLLQALCTVREAMFLSPKKASKNPEVRLHVTL